MNQFDLFKTNLQGHVSNDPIFPTDESMKLNGAFIVLLKNSNVARGHPPRKFQLNLNSKQCFSYHWKDEFP
jgi:hypothetical protein